MEELIDFQKVNEICAKALDVWGEKAQLGIAQEECGELIVAISHALRNRQECIPKFVEEVADVQVMLWQMQIMLSRMGLTQAYADIVNNKLDRLMERMNG